MQTILLFGGSSDERFVSVATAQNCAQSGLFTDYWFLTSEGEVYSVQLNHLIGHQNPFKEVFRAPSDAKKFNSLLTAVETLNKAESFLFLALHGAEGEDGTIQLLLERESIPYSGSNSVASALCFDKNKAKEKIASAQIASVAEGVRITSRHRWREAQDQIRTLFARVGKIVLKPNANGSSCGLYIIHHEEELANALSDLGEKKEFDYLAEPFITGRELTVGVIDYNGSTLGLPPSEVLLEHGRSFDYDGKYLGKGSQEITPADVSSEQGDLLKSTALKAHQALGCSGYSRTDFILTSNNELYFLETNTLPGLTKASFVPQQLACAEISFKAFLEAQLQKK